MRIATWNVNGVKARIDGLTDWLTQTQPDVACLQEIKSADESFPAEPFEALGYNLAIHGQKGFNGVAIFSKIPFESVEVGLPGNDEDAQARFIDATVATAAGPFRIACAYMPNGNPLGTEKYTYKLAWMDRLREWVSVSLRPELPLALVGDFNIIPDPVDAKNPAGWVDDALFQDEIRARFRELIHFGLTDTVRAVSAAPDLYTFWDFQGGAWQKNNGIRIDHIMLSPEAADQMSAAGIDKFTRAWEKPSDHVPVWAEFKITEP